MIVFALCVTLLCELCYGYGEDRPLLTSFFNAIPGAEYLAELIASKQQQKPAGGRHKKTEGLNVQRDRSPGVLPEYSHDVGSASRLSSDCPPGFVRGDENCEVIGLIDAEIICPSGCQVSSPVTLDCDCIEEGPVEERCHPGYEVEFRRSVSSGKAAGQHVCVRELTVPPSLVCASPGALLENGVCMKTVVSEAIPQCPGAHWKFTGDLCVTEETLSPQNECPDGFYRTSRGELLTTIATPRWLGSQKKLPRRIGPELAVAPGGDICVSRKTSQPMARCPVGSRVGGHGIGSVCLRDVYEMPSTQCPVGFQQDRDLVGQCRRDLQIPPEKICPNMFTPVNMYRALSEEDEEPEIVTSRAFTMPSSGAHSEHISETESAISEIGSSASSLLGLPSLEIDKHQRRLTLMPITDLQSSNPIASVSSLSKTGDFHFIDQSPASLPIPASTDNIECELKTYETPMPTCREGFEFSVTENACLKLLRESPTIKCKSPGYKFDGKSCVSIERSALAYVCPSGSILKGKICVSIETVPGVPSCPSNNHFKFEAGLGHCVGSEESPVHFECPTGMALHAATHTCVDTTSTGTQLTCPSKYHMDPIRSLCIKETAEQPIWRCVEMKGASSTPILMGNQCHTTIEVEPEEICPASFELVQDGSCHSGDVKLIEKKCPFGFVLFDNKCLRQFTLSGMYGCPPGMFNSARDESKCTV